VYAPDGDLMFASWAEAPAELDHGRHSASSEHGAARRGSASNAFQNRGRGFGGPAQLGEIEVPLVGHGQPHSTGMGGRASPSETSKPGAQAAM